MKAACSILAPAIGFLVALAAAVSPAAWAQPADQLPQDLEGVGITQRLDAELPLTAGFIDDQGRAVTLGDYFERDKPVLLTLVYYRCPMLCNLVLDGMIDALREIDWVPGREFEVVTVSIDPLETPQLAQHKKKLYLESYGRPEAADGWHFLTGKREQIDALAQAVGFGYQYVEERQEYAHSASLMLVTPAGRVSRYLPGIQHEPRTLRLSLVEASEGRIGSVVDQFLLYCYRYDSTSGQYTPLAWRFMRLGGVLTALVLGAALLTLWVRDAKHKRVAK